MSVIENPDFLQTSFKSFVSLNFFNCDALVILNQPIDLTKDEFRQLWNTAKIRVCADGGANRLHDYDSSYCPDFIVGDLDSLKKDVSQYFASRGTLVKMQETQYSSDFDKSIAVADLYLSSGKEMEECKQMVRECDEYKGVVELRKQKGQAKREEYKKGAKVEKFIVACVGALGGRIDHTLQSLARLKKEYDSYPHLQIHYVSSKEKTIYLSQGTHQLSFGATGCDCAILPLFEQVILNTVGLKWDVRDWVSSMNGNISSSNRVVSDIIEIQCSTSVIFSVSV